MKIFVTGATGVLGRRAVAQLVAAGADVTGVARTQEKAAGLRELGATPVEVSLFDPDRLVAVMAGHDVVCNLATAIPSGERAASRSAWSETHRIRRDGARNLVDAAIHVGADRYIQESDRVPVRRRGRRVPRRVGAGRPDLEHRVGARRRGRGGAVRRPGWGGNRSFASASSTVPTAPTRSTRLRRPGAASSMSWGHPTPSGRRSPPTTRRRRSWLRSARRAACTTSPTIGLFAERNIASALAEALGTHRLQPLPGTADLPDDLAVMLRSQRVTSQLFKTLTGWQPRFPSAWEGWRFVVAELQQRPVA